MIYKGNGGEYFEALEQNKYTSARLDSVEGQLSMIWFLEDDNELEIDTENHRFNKNQIIFLTSFNQVSINKISKYRYLRFNSPFYCIVNHDSEVGCKGILFFGCRTFPFITPDAEDIEKINTVWKMLFQEMKSADELQLEMLQMTLKRMLILSTRIYKSQTNFDQLETQKTDIVREFNFLVEQHFKSKHSVSEYAVLLNKSPKTLSNLFKKIHDKTPLQVIQNRIMLEVRRLLKYTDRPISEIGYEVGFNDIQSFSRFFKKKEGSSPSEFRLN